MTSIDATLIQTPQFGLHYINESVVKRDLPWRQDFNIKDADKETLEHKALSYGIDVDMECAFIVLYSFICLNFCIDCIVFD